MKISRASQHPFTGCWGLTDSNLTRILKNETVSQQRFYRIKPQKNRQPGTRELWLTQINTARSLRQSPGPAPSEKGMLRSQPLQCHGCLPNASLPRDGPKAIRQGQPIMRTESGVARQDGQRTYSATREMSETDGIRFTNSVMPFTALFQCGTVCSGLATDLWCWLGSFFCFPPFHYSLLF